MHAVEAYLSGLAKIRATGGGTKETSYYGVLENLLNEVGGKLKPKVRAVPQLANAGAGQPDFGLYTSNQFQRSRDREPLPGQLPERGVIEVKSWSDDSFLTARKDQVSKYWKKYGLVLVTNYRDFLLLGRDEHEKPVLLETYRMAESEGDFRNLLDHPRKAASDQGDRFLDFLRRVLLCEAALTDPEDLAWFLASYAREARHRIEAAKGLPALAGLKKALEEALGMAFEGEKGEHFFQATLVQTLFYGIFSSWVLWSRDTGYNSDAHFDWHNAAWTLHVPMVASLFDQIATPQKLKPLGVAEVLDWAGAALNRVDRPAFFAKFEEEHAVQYFYEPFLKAYDPDLRKELGVWYTPPEIVQYQVERVDRVLREELDIPDGLADDRVVVLDPCCGTGAYLVETLKRIHKTLDEMGSSALTAQKLKKAAIERVFGFEILPAPFVVAHLQLGLMLRLLGAPLEHDSNQRAGVYLTNALTGWEPLEDPKDLLPFPELMEERDAANKVKQEAPILVIIGNPPYNAFAGTSPQEEGGLVDVYKEGLTTPFKQGGWGIKKFNLDDLYVRFFRIAERRIVKSEKGVVCFISNFSYLSDPSFVVMRERLLAEFDKLWFDCMNGDSRETGKLTPDGEPDPSVFSTEQSPVGIRVGTAISLLVRKEERDKRAAVRFQHYWGITKRNDVLASLRLKNLNRKYEMAHPSTTNRYSFRPSRVSGTYLTWPKVVDLAAKPPFGGPIERRGNSLIIFPDQRDQLRLRLSTYFDPAKSDEEVLSLEPAFMKSSGEFDAGKSRSMLKGSATYRDDKLVSYPFKPFDIRLAYLDPAIAPLFSRPGPELLAHAELDGNAYFITRDTADKDPEGVPFLYSTLVCDYDALSGHARHFPIRLRQMYGNSKDDERQNEMFAREEMGPAITANFSLTARTYIAQSGVSDLDTNAKSAGVLWVHALAIGYSPIYLEENADGIRQDWPRIPLPAKKKALFDSAVLGRRVAALLDTVNPVDGVTCGKIDTCLRSLGVIQRVGGGALNPDAGELDMTAGWGHAGARGVCMPGRGKTADRKAKSGEIDPLLGERVLDVYLNDVAYWANVPQAVWDYTIGGYQVIKKWLSYREKNILGRGLKMEEAEYVTEMVRRIAALILLQPELDANYERVKSDTWPWPEPSR